MTAGRSVNEKRSVSDTGLFRDSAETRTRDPQLNESLRRYADGLSLFILLSVR